MLRDCKMMCQPVALAAFAVFMMVRYSNATEETDFPSHAPSTFPSSLPSTSPSLVPSSSEPSSLPSSVPSMTPTSGYDPHNRHGGDPNVNNGLIPDTVELTECEKVMLWLTDQLHDDDDDFSTDRRLGKRKKSYSGSSEDEESDDFHIRVVFHSMETSRGKLGLLDADMTKFQDTLIKGFQNTPFTFDFSQGRISHRNDDWQKCTSYPSANYMKWYSRVGGADTLNIYVAGLQSRSMPLGFSTFPHESKRSDGQINQLDGIVIRNPRYETRDYVKPDEIYWTLVHEVGHWLGLLHTFDGGCDVGLKTTVHGTRYQGDGVDDTAAHRQPSWYESGWRKCFQKTSGSGRRKRQTTSCLKTCSGSKKGYDEGCDPVNNQMNYIHEKCMKQHGEFTPGQIKRMKTLTAVYRKQSHGRRRRLADIQDKHLVRTCAASPIADCDCDPDCIGRVFSALSPYGGLKDEVFQEFANERCIDSCGCDPDCLFKMNAVLYDALLSGQIKTRDSRAQRTMFGALRYSAQSCGKRKNVFIKDTRTAYAISRIQEAKCDKDYTNKILTQVVTPCETQHVLEFAGCEKCFDSDNKEEFCLKNPFVPQCSKDCDDPTSPSYSSSQCRAECESGSCDPASGFCFWECSTPSENCGDGVRVCNQDYRCVHKFELGQLCYGRDGLCKSGKCEDGVCVLSKQCHTPFALDGGGCKEGSHYCTEDLRCVKRQRPRYPCNVPEAFPDAELVVCRGQNSMCDFGVCKTKVKCSSDQPCGPSNYCDTDIGFCRRKQNLPFGTPCSVDGACLSRNCENGQCGVGSQCMVDQDCPTARESCIHGTCAYACEGQLTQSKQCGQSEFCSSSNRCAKKKDAGESCKVHIECKSRLCTDGKKCFDLEDENGCKEHERLRLL